MVFSGLLLLGFQVVYFLLLTYMSIEGWVLNWSDLEHLSQGGLPIPHREDQLLSTPQSASGVGVHSSPPPSRWRNNPPAGGMGQDNKRLNGSFPP